MLSMDYKQEYEEFWKDIVENEDGTLNKDKVMRELCNYNIVLENCTKAYCFLSNNRINDPLSSFDDVMSIYNKLQCERTSDDHV